MGKVVADITMSLDGLVTGPDDGPGRGLGEGGECLHNRVMGRPWRYDDGGRRFDPVDVDRHVLAEALSAGARIIGRRMFDVTGGWGGNPPGGPSARYFVLTHAAPREWASPDSPFTFVTDGIESALAQARAAVGDQGVTIGGGANVIQQYLAAGLVKTRSAPAASMSAATTCAPAAASALAHAAPMPLAAPVTRARRPVSDPADAVMRYLPSWVVSIQESP